MLTPKYGGHATKMTLGEFYDQGLLYQAKSTGWFECVSGPAQKALTTMLSSAMRHNLSRIDSVTVSCCCCNHHLLLCIKLSSIFSPLLGSWHERCYS